MIWKILRNIKMAAFSVGLVFLVICHSAFSYAAPFPQGKTHQTFCMNYEFFEVLLETPSGALIDHFHGIWWHQRYFGRLASCVWPMCFELDVSFIGSDAFSQIDVCLNFWSLNNPLEVPSPPPSSSSEKSIPKKQHVSRAKNSFLLLLFGSPCNKFKTK